MSVITDVTKCITMDAKKTGNHLLLVGTTRREMGGSHYLARRHQIGNSVPTVNLTTGPQTARAVASLISRNLIRSAHDCSEGGLAVALAEMLFAGGLGHQVDLAGVVFDGSAPQDEILLFSESPSRYLLEVQPTDFDTLARALKSANIPFGVLGNVETGSRLKIRSVTGAWVMDEDLNALKKSWLATLDW